MWFRYSLVNSLNISLGRTYIWTCLSLGRIVMRIFLLFIHVYMTTTHQACQINVIGVGMRNMCRSWLHYLPAADPLALRAGRRGAGG